MCTHYIVAFAPRHAVRAPNSSPIEMKSKQVEISREMARGCLEHGPAVGNRGTEEPLDSATSPRRAPQARLTCINHTVTGLKMHARGGFLAHVIAPHISNPAPLSSLRNCVCPQELGGLIAVAARFLWPFLSGAASVTFFGRCATGRGIPALMTPASALSP